MAPQDGAGEETKIVCLPAMDHMAQGVRHRAMRVTARKVAEWADTYDAYSGMNDEERRGPVPRNPARRATLIDSVLDWLDEAVADFAPVFFVLRRGQNVLWQWGEEHPSMLLLRPDELGELEREWAQSGLPPHLYKPQCSAADLQVARPTAARTAGVAGEAQQEAQVLGAVEWQTENQDPDRELFRAKCITFREALLARIGEVTQAGKTPDAEEGKLLQGLLAQVSAVIRYPYEQQLRAAIRGSKGVTGQES